MLFLNSSSVKDLISTSSILIDPLTGSNTLVNRLKIVLLPCPDLPTIAIFLLGSIDKLKSLRIVSSSG